MAIPEAFGGVRWGGTTVRSATKRFLAFLACLAVVAPTSVWAQRPASSANSTAGRYPRVAQYPGAYTASPEALPPGAISNGTISATELPSNDTSIDPDSIAAQMASSPFAAPVTDSCDAYFGRGSACPPQWYVDQGVRLLVRGKPRMVPMGRELKVVPGLQLPGVIDSRAVNYEAQAGYTLTLGYHLGHDSENRDQYFEFTYWGMNHWNESYAVTGSRLTVGAYTFGNLFSPFEPSNNIYDSFVPGFNRADEMSINSRSEIHNFEWNLRLIPRGRADRLVLHPDGRWEREIPQGCQWHYLIGLRYLTFDESFAFRARGRITQGGSNVAFPTGDYLSFTTNDMAGLQAGVEMHWRKPRWDFGARVKAGPYINWAGQSTYCRTTGGGDDPFAGGFDLNFDTRANNAKTAFVGELGLFASYKLRKNFNLHASYDFYWVSGLALAPEQIRFETNPSDHIASLTTLLFQGMSLRAELLW